MRDSPSLPLRLICSLLFLLLLAGSAGAGLTVVRLNQEKGQLAADTVRFQRELDDTDRRWRESSAAVAQVEQPDRLKSMIGTRLVQMQDKQIVYVRPSTTPTPVELAPTQPASLNFHTLAVSNPVHGVGLTQ